MNNYLVTFKVCNKLATYKYSNEHKIALSYKDSTSVKAVVTFIREMANRLYPEYIQKDIKGNSNGYEIIINDDISIHVYIEEIDGIFSLS